MDMTLKLPIPKHSRPPSPRRPFEAIYDLLHSGACTVDEVRSLLELRKKRREAAIFCSDSATILLSTKLPEWFGAWMRTPQPVLFYGVTPSVLLGRVCAALVPSRAEQFHAAGLLMDCVMNGSFVVSLIRQGGARIVAHHIDDKFDLPPYSALEVYIERYPRGRQSRAVGLMEAAHHLFALSSEDCGRVLSIRVGIVRMLIEEPCPNGVCARMLNLYDGPGTSALDHEALAKRYHYAAARMWTEAVADALEEINYMLRPSVDAPPDTTFVFASRGSSHLAQICSDYSSYIFASAEARFLQELGTTTTCPGIKRIDPVHPGIADMSADELDVAQAVIQIIDHAKTGMNPNLMTRDAVLQTIRAPTLVPKFVEAERVQLGNVLAHLARVSTLLIYENQSDEWITDARIMEALNRCCSTYPLRIRMQAFVRLYGKLSELSCSQNVELVRDICSTLNSGSYAISPHFVLLSRTAKAQLDRELDSCGETDTALLDRLRTEAATEALRIERAFPEEYKWLQLAHPLDHRPRTPRAMCAATPSPSPPRRFDRCADAAAFLEKLFSCREALTRSGNSERGACILGLRVMRALGWMELQALDRCIDALVNRLQDGIVRATMLLALAELVILTFRMMIGANEMEEQCMQIATRAIVEAGCIYSRFEAKIFESVLFERNDITYSPLDGLHALCAPWMPFTEIATYFAMQTDAECANLIAARGPIEMGDAAEMIVRLQEIDSHNGFRCIEQLINARMAENHTLQRVGAAACPLLNPAWIEALRDHKIPAVQACISKASVHLDLCEITRTIDCTALRATWLLQPPRDVMTAIFDQ